MTPSDRLLDEINRQLLDALQRDARTPFSELGRAVGLSAPAVAERVRRLEDAGLIRAYRAVLEPAALGYALQAYVRLTVDRGEDDAFIAHARATPEILVADRVTGSDCYVLRVAVTGVAHLEAAITALKAFGTPTTSLILSSVKDDVILQPPHR
ncbi:Lrp/AsnC family transcriptional regulator [Deinococcus maricopensis]|uniref:Transcriptional regulator, AsnC family n=1 Tax=Deinococcus maricopensis (strain DSM 21211 / LMG 22137 / NRRL B-23946 / LB-34) TaxID=709986 RepID=E8U6V2_DEIML|nr:Lrp/AsnC family transcriptional regulator [Deinococcus maricopensis]ADV66791.1 transcriptional regulator, AsnC family [Deinococcus maricopensis DSM 21211]